MFLKNISRRLCNFNSLIGRRNLAISQRFYTDNNGNVSQPGSSGSSKASLIRELRRKTGAGISLCLEALDSQSDILAAEKYIEAKLKENAIAIQRSTSDVSNGLIGLATDIQRTSVFMTKLSCRTDFVAKTKEFQDTMRTITSAALLNFKNDYKGALPNEKILFDYERIKDFKVSSESGADTIESVIQQLSSKVGEKLVLEDSIAARIHKDSFLGTYVHHPEQNAIITDQYQFFFGRIGAFCIVYRSKFDSLFGSEHKSRFFKLADEVAIHVVGMLPTSIGLYTDELAPFSSGDKQLSDFYTEKDRSDVLLDQDFFLTPQFTVRQWCNTNYVRIHDFVLLE